VLCGSVGGGGVPSYAIHEPLLSVGVELVRGRRTFAFSVVDNEQSFVSGQLHDLGQKLISVFTNGLIQAGFVGFGFTDDLLEGWGYVSHGEFSLVELGRRGV
jgi:hypothetical protein